MVLLIEPRKKKLKKNSFWFLFPVANYGPLSIEDVVESSETCFGCDSEFSDVRLFDSLNHLLKNYVSLIKRSRLPRSMLA